MLMFLLACDGATGDSADSAAEVDRAPLVLALTGDVAAGGEIYSGFCVSCHGYAGEGDIGPAMTEVVPEATREHLVDVVLNGWDSDEQSSQMTGMPSLTDQNIADVVDYCMATWM